MLFSLFLNALMLLDETVSPSRAFQRLITRREKKYFLTSLWHLGLLSLAKWPCVLLLLRSKVNRDSKWTVFFIYLYKSPFQRFNVAIKPNDRKTFNKRRVSNNRRPLMNRDEGCELWYRVLTRNSSGNEIANVNFYDDIVHPAIKFTSLMESAHVHTCQMRLTIIYSYVAFGNFGEQDFLQEEDICAIRGST